MFPWESAASGEETCPTRAGTGLREIHISGDIAIAVELMFEATGSTAWLASTGFPIVSQVAEMWCSRAEPSNEDNLLHINGVIPPDELVHPSSVAHFACFQSFPTHASDTPITRTTPFTPTG